MSILPTTNTNIHNTGPSTSSTSYYNEHTRQRKTSFFYRLTRVQHMDFEFALWQMGYLLISPRRVYRNIYYHKQTKNRWSRQDPAFLVIIITFLTLIAIGWSIVYHFNLYDTVKTVLSMVLLQFLLIGSIISTITWYITNKFLTQNTNSYAIAQKVEWLYAFDVHCNSFIPFFILIYVVQLFFLPLLSRDSWMSMLMGNLMYCIALIWYIVGTFLGFNALPFLVHTELLLYPIALCIAMFIASLFGFNITHSMLQYHFFKK